MPSLMRIGDMRAAGVLVLLTASFASGPSRPMASTAVASALLQTRPSLYPLGRTFYFTRAAYTGYGYGRRRRGLGSWATDYPKADIQFMIGVTRLTNIDAYAFENAIALDDPELRRYPLLYAVEVGRMALTAPEIEGLRAYLLAGGQLIVDDFWGTREWANFEFNIRRVLPEYSIVEIPMDHPLLRTFYNIDEVVQVPNIYNGRMGGPTWERDGFVPHLRGIFDEENRLLVAINFNSDLGDAWEWAEDPFYPIVYSNYAYQIGVNMILYGMSR